MQNCRYSKMGTPFIAYRGHIATAVIAAVASAAVVFFIVSLVNKPTLNPDDCKLLLATSEHGRRPCLPNWIGYQMKCFYFSDEEKTWSASQDFCSLYNASLAIIEKEEKAFVQRYKGTISHWIGLQRDPNQPWKWVNGNASTWEVLGDGGHCAFLNDEGKASCSRCQTLHHWICSKPDEFTSPKIV
ncbi:C-type lectin domain family 2 member D-like [Pantherophis guttatus]|uniref:C-type lectin domain family 2 member D-like n=1 Tax=Pantherophis guttatus TaxID=94885 RepID=A0ABM3ZFG2_PANGU|nr:C-type lectin domain family 2 member D-like [Pantherophis guttatus]XP_060547110.1 C-type lectin domain family 2 member D-like [Pantherophis guttatus]